MAIRTLKSDPNGPPLPGYPEVKGTIETTYVGAVLATGEYNGYDDSDFYAEVWDEPTGTVKRVVYATTRGWTYANGAAVDATPEVKEKAAVYYAKAALAGLLDKAADAARTVEKGKTVKVVKGRKVPLGTTGTVIWVGEGRYYGPVPKYRGGWAVTPPLRIGVKDADGTVHWTAATNVEVVDPEDYLPDFHELTVRAAATGRDRAGLGTDHWGHVSKYVVAA